MGLLCEKCPTRHLRGGLLVSLASLNITYTEPIIRLVPQLQNVIARAGAGSLQCSPDPRAAADLYWEQVVPGAALVNSQQTNVNFLF